MNLFGILPDIDFVEKNPETIKNAIIKGYEDAYHEETGDRITLYPGDPRRLFLLSVADVIILQRNLIDWSAKQNVLAYSKGGPLDHLGFNIGVTRLSPSKALTTARFTLSAPRQGVTAIPAGVRITLGDGDIYFATVSALEIPPGETAGDVGAEALEPGARANGLLPGQINRLVDPLPYVRGVSNVTASEGGADAEDDENFRERVHIAPESFSVAGPVGAYIYWARSASQLIIDVSVDSPTPGEVRIYPLLAGGELPGAEILNLVYAKVSADDIRPTSDYVQVLTPETVGYDIRATWYLERGNVAAANAVTAAVGEAVAGWKLWQRSALGRDINTDELVARVKAAGAKRIDIASPSFTPLAFNQVAVPGAESVTYGGVEDG